ncbi:unnamed protein product [Ectocarpus fasciculatus]
MERQCVATMVILVWVKLMDPLQGVFQDFFLLVKMIALMIGKLVRSFLPLLAIIYVAWAFARYTLLGELEFLMKSISSAVATQYPETLGEFTFDDIRAENLYQSWRYSFTALFTVLVVVIMLNLLVSLLNDLSTNNARKTARLAVMAFGGARSSLPYRAGLRAQIVTPPALGR